MRTLLITSLALAVAPALGAQPSTAALADEDRRWRIEFSAGGEPPFEEPGRTTYAVRRPRGRGAAIAARRRLGDAPVSVRALGALWRRSGAWSRIDMNGTRHSSLDEAVLGLAAAFDVSGRVPAVPRTRVALSMGLGAAAVRARVRRVYAYSMHGPDVTELSGACASPLFTAGAALRVRRIVVELQHAYAFRGPAEDGIGFLPLTVGWRF